MAGACKKNDAKGETSKPLGVLNFTSAFILLTSGMLLAVVLLLLEHVYFAFFRAKLRKCDTVGCCSLVSLVGVLLDVHISLLVRAVIATQNSSNTGSSGKWKRTNLRDC